MYVSSAAAAKPRSLTCSWRPAFLARTAAFLLRMACYAAPGAAAAGAAAGCSLPKNTRTELEPEPEPHAFDRMQHPHPQHPHPDASLPPRSWLPPFVVRRHDDFELRGRGMGSSNEHDRLLEGVRRWPLAQTSARSATRSLGEATRRPRTACVLVVLMLATMAVPSRAASVAVNNESWLRDAVANTSVSEVIVTADVSLTAGQLTVPAPGRVLTLRGACGRGLHSSTF
jgi:hypothetical protein